MILAGAACLMEKNLRQIDRNRDDTGVRSGSMQRLLAVDWILHKFVMLWGVGNRHWLGLPKLPEQSPCLLVINGWIKFWITNRYYCHCLFYSVIVSYKGVEVLLSGLTAFSWWRSRIIHPVTLDILIWVTYRGARKFVVTCDFGQYNS
jgi:hypothetical protein